MKQYKVTVNGQSYDVSVEEVGAAGNPGARPVPQAAQAVAWAAQASQASQASLVANAVVHTVKATTNDESGRTTALAKMADLVRAIVPICPVNATLEGSR